jgi:hypothetical protein
MVTQHYPQWCTDRLLLEFHKSAVEQYYYVALMHGTDVRRDSP